MIRSSLIVALVVLAGAGAACGRDAGMPEARHASNAAGNGVDAPAKAASARVPGSQRDLLNEIVESYFDKNLELNPIYATLIGDHRYNDRFGNSIGPAYRDATLALNRTSLEAVRRVDVSRLTRQGRLTWEIFVRDREEAIEGAQFPTHLLPINQFFSVPNFFATLGSGDGAQPFETVADFDNWLSRANGFAIWMTQAVQNMREGMETGIVQPKVLMQRTLPQLAAQVDDDVEQSLFYQPIVKLPASFSAADRKRLDAAYRAAIRDVIVPAYRQVHDFVRDQYLPACRDTFGLGALPGGDAWYEYLVKIRTTTDLTAQDIHQIGLDEVARIHGQMDGVIARVGFAGNRTEFFTFLTDDKQFYYTEPEQLLNGYRDLRERVHPRTLDLFERFPEADYEIRAVEAFREKSQAVASYQQPTPDGSRPGIFYVNTYDLASRPKWAMESLFLHEAVPGHHFQSAIQIELGDLPRFRRFGGYTAYNEGWGLYAESLGPELGMYEDPYQQFGALSAELWRAIRLVVDTGIHYKGWTRQQVLDYMHANSPTAASQAEAEAERYMALPGQALAYKIGQLKMAELRARAEAKLQIAFDISAFHSQVLDDGALPLDVLEQKIDRWIETFL